MGFGWQPAHGVRGGNVIDLDMAEKAIRAAVGQAEDAANTRLRSITATSPAGSGIRDCSMRSGQSADARWRMRTSEGS